MNLDFNSKLQSWLYDEHRSLEVGCLLLLQMENNRIHYNNLLRHPNRKMVMEYLVKELGERLKVRLAVATKGEVEAMDAKVRKIEEEHFAHEKGTSDEDFRKGKRSDHDSLPDEIQALYVENLSLLQRMREVHLQLRQLSKDKVSCPDSERYPFLKELIDLDKQIHENWYRYDHFKADGDDSAADDLRAVTSSEDVVSDGQNPTTAGEEKGVPSATEGQVAQESAGSADNLGASEVKKPRKTTAKKKAPAKTKAKKKE